MSNNLYLGNLPYSATEEEIEAIFSKVAEVESVKIILDRDTQQSRGFGFIMLGDNCDPNAVIDELDGSDFKGRPLVVRVARDKNDRNRRRPDTQRAY